MTEQTKTQEIAERIGDADQIGDMLTTDHGLTHDERHYLVKVILADLTPADLLALLDEKNKGGAR